MTRVKMTDAWSRDAFPPVSEACVSSFIKSFDFTQMLKWVVVNKEECEKRFPRLRDKNAWKSLLHHVETTNSMNIVMTDPKELLRADQAWNHESYLGKRVMRGLFRSSIGKVLNADINGAIGILRKVNAISDADIDSLRDRGDVVSPRLLRYGA